MGFNFPFIPAYSVDKANVSWISGIMWLWVYTMYAFIRREDILVAQHVVSLHVHELYLPHRRIFIGCYCSLTPKLAPCNCCFWLLQCARLELRWQFHGLSLFLFFFLLLLLYYADSCGSLPFVVDQGTTCLFHAKSMVDRQKPPSSFSLVVSGNVAAVLLTEKDLTYWSRACVQYGYLGISK